MSGREAVQLARDYESLGFRVEHGRHYKVYDQGNRMVAVLASTPGRGRAAANARAQLRRVIRQREAGAA